MNTTKTASEESRLWPFTMRISRRERHLLRIAAEQAGRSRADVARDALDPLFAVLASKLLKE